ncbi:hypothetical protein DFJ74DRAFT_693576 [Hyaloraphidium curvatum]|nr:hypothetical protein DFJ74DRAFT_693576 [Hyaloraphidium curvatum]
MSLPLPPIPTADAGQRCHAHHRLPLDRQERATKFTLNSGRITSELPVGMWCFSLSIRSRNGACGGSRRSSARTLEQRTLRRSIFGVPKVGCRVGLPHPPPHRPFTSPTLTETGANRSTGRSGPRCGSGCARRAPGLRDSRCRSTWPSCTKRRAGCWMRPLGKSAGCTPGRRRAIGPLKTSRGTATSGSQLSCYTAATPRSATTWTGRATTSSSSPSAARSTSPRATR